MERFSPKIELINHFDDLIQRVDIDIEESLKKYNENQILGELAECIQVKKRYDEFKLEFRFRIKFESYLSSDENKEQKVDQWSESTKVIDYLNQIRMRTIEELRKEQKESVENSSCLNNLINSELTKEEKRSEIFGEKFYFQVKFKRPDIKSTIFNLFTFVTDFYISQSDIELLEKLINRETQNKQQINQKFNHILDEKMVLIGLLYKHFRQNLKHKKFPNHVIYFFKQDVSKISDIDFKYKISAVKLNGSSIDLSKLTYLTIRTSSALDDVIIDSLYSLEYLSLNIFSAKQISFRNLYALKELKLDSENLINIKIDNSTNIQSLSFNYHFMKFESEILKKPIINSCENITNILSEYHFANLLELTISFSDITRLERKLFNSSMPSLRLFNVSFNDLLEIIDHDAFSDLKQLVCLELSHNSINSLDKRHFSGLISLESLYLDSNRLKSLDENALSDLKNLESLNLSRNEFEILDAKLFVGLENLIELDLSNNKLTYFDVRILDSLPQIENIDLSGNEISIENAEILKRFKDSKIEFKF